MSVEEAFFEVLGEGGPNLQSPGRDQENGGPNSFSYLIKDIVITQGKVQTHIGIRCHRDVCKHSSNTVFHKIKFDKHHFRNLFHLSILFTFQIS